MATKSDPQTFVNTGADPALRTIYAGTTQAIPASASTANVYITQTSQVNYTTVKATNVVNQAGGNANSVQFKTASGTFAGDDGFVYNPDTDTITAGKLVVTSNTVSTSIDTGSATFAGGVGIDGNIIANRTLYIGFAANASVLLNPTIIAKSTGTTYVQGALINVTESGSADWVAYADNGTETTGWADMGFTGSEFNDPTYTITGINDGYVFAQGTDVEGAGGNLVLATGELGEYRDIVFATGGFLVENEFARISDANGSFEITRANASITFPDGSIQTTAYTGGSSGTGNVTFADVTVQGVYQLQLSPGPDATANLKYLQVRAGDVDSHIHFDTGDNDTYDQFFGDDGKYLKLTAGAAGNIVIGTDNNAWNWTFDSEGNLTVPGNIQSVTTGFAFSSAISGVDTGNVTVVVTLTDGAFPDPVTGQVTITDVVGTTEANGTWYFQAVDPDKFQLYYDQALENPVDGTTWTAYESGGLAVAQGYNDISITGGNVGIVTNNGLSWTFDTNGAITLPSATGPGYSTGYIQTPNAYPTLLAYGSGGHGGPELDWMNSDNIANGFGNSDVLRNTMYLNDEGFYVGVNENNVANTFTGSWRFTPSGTTIFPTIEVDLHNGGVQEGQVLQFGDTGQQAIITGPAPTVDNNAQRLIIQGQRGNGQYSEGGDVYFWAGDADTYGGDIKIYAGDADNVSAGYGGYVNINGGSGFNEGGHIALNGGQSTSGPGGYVEIYAGQGASHGGNLTLGAGYGGTGPGGVVILQGGGSGNGLAEYGNVVVQSGSSTWTFDNAGSLTLPGNLVLNGAIIKDGTNTVVTDGINSIALALGAQMDVYGFPFSVSTRGQLTITDVTTPSEANGTWYYQSVNTNAYQLYTDSTYTVLVDATGWSAYTGGGSVAITKSATAANISVDSNGYLTKFANDGTVTFPGNAVITGSAVFAGNLVGTGASPAPSINGFDSASFANIVSAPNIVFNSNIYISNGFTISSLSDIGGQVDYNDHTVGYVADNNGSASLYARDSAGLGDNNAIVTANATNGTVLIKAANAALSDRNWVFDGAGNLTFPDLSVQSTAWSGNLVANNTAYQQTNTFYVDPARTDTYTSIGTAIKPFKTISAAISAAVTAGYNDSNPAFIVLMASITENITLKPGIWLTSFGTGTHGSPIITGTVTVTSSTGTTSSNHYAMSNLRIVAPSSEHGINYTGTAPQKLFLRDMWIDANTTKTCIFMDNTGTGSTLHIDTAHLAHSGTGDVYAIDVTHGSAYLRDIETSGTIQVAAVRSGAVMTIDGSEIDANNDAAIEVYGGTLTVTNSVVTNAKANSNGIALNTAGSVCTLLNVLMSVPAGTGKTVYGVASTALYYLNVAFVPGTNTSKTAGGTMTAVQLSTSFT